MILNDNKSQKDKLPDSFRPLLWGLRWDDISVKDDIEDIVVNTINEGSLSQWQLIVSIYGKDKIRNVLEKRLKSEFHPESRNLAQLIFNIPSFRNAR